MTQTFTLTRRRWLGALGAAGVLAACGEAPRSLRPSRATTGRRALLLPLTGSRAALGKQMAKAVWLVEDFGGLPGRTQVLDAGDTPQSAAAAATEARTKGASIIVGPLFRTQTPAVLDAAGAIPVLTLSNDDALAEQGAWVLGVAPRQSLEAVANYAKSSGAKRLALVHSNGPLSERSHAALTTAARARRLTVLPSIPDSTPPSGVAAALRAAGQGQLPDIVYIPERQERAIAQAVSAVQAGVTTIGSLQWSGLPQNELKRLDKACFTGPDPVRFNSLSAAYRHNLEEEMGVIAALTVDAVAVAHEFKAGEPPRKPITGLLGETSLNRNRTTTRALSILRIDGGNVVKVA